MLTQAYMAFTPKFPPDVAVVRFEKKYGCKPKRIFIEKGLLKLGPEPTNGDKRENEVPDPSH